MEPAQAKVIEVKSLSEINQRIVAMCMNDDGIYVATEYEVYRLNGVVWEQLTFKVIE